MRDLDPTLLDPSIPLFKLGMMGKKSPIAYDPGSILGAGASLVGGIMGSNAASDAADAQSQAAGNSIAEQRRQYDLSRQDQSPFIKTGTAANSYLGTLLGLPGYNTNLQQLIGQAAGRGYDSGYRYGDADRGGIMQGAIDNYKSGAYGSDADAMALFGIDPASVQQDSNFGSLLKKFSQSDLQSDPVYQSGLQFGLDQGTAGINARALAGGSPGGFDSGATLKALTRYANDYGSTKANDSFNRFNTQNNNIYNRLAGVSGAGQTATNNVQVAGQNMANQVSNAYADQGNARAAGIVGGANAWGDALTGLGKNLNNSGFLKGLASGSGSSSGYTPDNSWAGVQDFSAYGGGSNDYQGYY